MNSTESTKRITVLQKHDTWYWILSFHISFLSIVGNTAVIYVILATPKLQTKQNTFILSLAVADLCVGLFITPTDFICSRLATCELQLQVVFYNFLLIASMANLMALTIDRYIAVFYPMKYTLIITKSTTAALITVAWLFAFFVSFLPLSWLYNENHDILKRNDRVYRVAINLGVGLLPCLIVLFAFWRIFIAVRGQLSRQESQLMQVAFNHNNTQLISTNLSETSPTQDKNYNLSLAREKNEKLGTNSQKKHRHHSSVRVLGGVVLLFVFCYSFNIILSLCYDFDLCETTPVFKEISMIFVYVNSSVNFIVYAFLKKEFRQSLNFRIRSLHI